MGHRKIAYLLLSVMILVSMKLRAQSASGSISGTVTDESAAVIPGAKVSVTNVDTGINRITVTDQGGRYQVAGLIPGPYEVHAELEGFQTELRKGIQLNVGSELVIPIALKVGQITQTAIVTAEAPMIEITSSALSGLVDEETIQDLPLNGRSFNQLVSLDSAAPTFRSHGGNSANGTADVFSVNGNRTKANLYLMDGVELVGGNASSTMPGGVLGINMGVDAVQEFQVYTSNYSAAYGKRSGGIINIATRSGTNQIHGAAFEFLRNSALDARNFFDVTLEPPSFKRNQFGGAIGGPVRKDEAFFFGNYEGLRQGLGLTSISTVPDNNTRAGLLPCRTVPTAPCDNTTGLANIGVAPSVRPFLALWPTANGRNFGDGTAEFNSSPNKVSIQDYFLGRIDYKLSDKDFLFGRYNFSKASVETPDSTGYFTAFSTSRDQALVLEEKRVYATLLNALRFGFSRGRTKDTTLIGIPIDSSMLMHSGADTVGQISPGSVGTGSAGIVTSVGTGSGYNRYWVATVFDTSDQVSYHRGSHSLQFGAQVQRIQHNEDFGTQKNGLFNFVDLASFLQGRPLDFRAPGPGANATKGYRLNYFATYVQDDYKVTTNFTLNLGLRYEFLTPPTEVNGRLSNFRPIFINGLRTLESTPHLASPFFGSNFKTFAPRLGFAWDLFGDGKTSLRSGFGMFYDQIESEYRSTTASNAPYFGTLIVNNPPFPQGFSGTIGQQALPSVDGIEFNSKVPTRLQFNVNFQQQLGVSTVFNIGYVGAHSYHFWRTSDGNGAVPTFLEGGIKFFPAGAPRRNPALSQSRLNTSDGNANYHSLQLALNQRLSHGLRYKISFTFAKAIDDVSMLDSADASGAIYASQDPENTKADRGLSAFDVRRNLVMNFTYDLPGRNVSGILGKLIGGWQFGAINTISDGTPITVLDGFSRARDLARTIADRPDLKPGASNNPVLGGPDGYFDTSAFVLAAPGFYGNLGRNTLIGPGFVGTDLTLEKTTSVNERFKVGFRAEVFNVINRANFGLPGNTVFNSNGTIRPTAGLIRNTVSTSRQIQFGLKITF